MIDREIVAGGYVIVCLSDIYPIFIVYLWYVVVREQGVRSREGGKKGKCKKYLFCDCRMEIFFITLQKSIININLWQKLLSKIPM